jgi:putative hemolysin
MTIVEIVIVVLLVLLAGFFAMAEFSVVSSRRNRLEQLAAKGRSGARVAIELADQPVRFLAAVQVGTTLSTMLVGTLSGAILAVRFAAWLDEYPPIAAYGAPAAIVILVAATTYLSLILGELVPKQLALKYPETIASRVAPPLSILTRAAVPIISILDTSSNFVLRLMGLRAGIERTVTEEDIHSIVAEGAKLGVIHHIEHDMSEGVLELADSAVRSIMTPRPHVAWVDINDSRDSILSKIASCPYAQMLVSRDSIDEVVGIVRKQDLLDQSLRGEQIDIEHAVRRPLIVPEVTSILRTLDLFRATPVNEALVVDEFGNIQGIVTRTDLLEAVAGDLAKVEGDSGPKITRRDDGSFIIDAAMPMDQVMKLLRQKSLPPGDFVTLAGFVLSQFSRMPQRGERFVWDEWDFQVAEMDGSRIGRLLVQPRR